MITIVAESKQYGSSKQYIARLTGRDAKYTFEREFIGTRSDRQSRADVDDVGLYEQCDITKKGEKDPTYLVVAVLSNGTLGKLTATKEEAMTIAKRLGAGEPLDSIIVLFGRVDDQGQPLLRDDGTQRQQFNVRTPGEARKASAAATVSSATASCWDVLQRLPEKEAKKVLRALAGLVSPPKPKPAAGAVVEQSAEEPEMTDALELSPEQVADPVSV